MSITITFNKNLQTAKLTTTEQQANLGDKLSSVSSLGLSLPSGTNFSAWTTSETGDGFVYSDEDVIPDNIVEPGKNSVTLYAYYGSTVQFILDPQDGGIKYNKVILTQTSSRFIYSISYLKLTVPTRGPKSGFIFGAWNTNSNGNGIAISNSGEIPNSILSSLENSVITRTEKTLYALYGPSLKITFDKNNDNSTNNGVVFYEKSQTVAAGIAGQILYTTLQIVANNPTNKSFGVWNTDQTNASITNRLTDGDVIPNTLISETSISAGVKLYAIWGPTLKITFDGDSDGLFNETNNKLTKTIDIAKNVEGQKFPTVKQLGFTSTTGLICTGWCVGRGGVGTSYNYNYDGSSNDIPTTITSNITLYAKYSVIITFNVFVFETISKSKAKISIIIERGSTGKTFPTFEELGLTSNPKYKFLGWNSQSNLSGKNYTYNADGTGKLIPTTTTSVNYYAIYRIVSESCLLKGTLILTSNGEVPIENIQVGDKVILSNGKTSKIIHTRYEEFDSANPIDLYKINKCAFATNVPSQDLYLSPRHVFGINGKLYHPEHLTLEGVEKCLDKTEFTLYNIQLEDYLDGLLIANGLEVEGYLDDKQVKSKHDLLSLNWSCEYKNRFGLSVSHDCQLIKYHSYQKYFKIEIWKPFLVEQVKDAWKIYGTRTAMIATAAALSVCLLSL